jgi:hypothetical protein
MLLLRQVRSIRHTGTDRLVPDLFKGPEVTWWQTLGLLLLSKILLTGVIGHGPHRHPYDYHDHPWKDREKWRKRFEARMNHIHEQKEEGERAAETE